MGYIIQAAQNEGFVVLSDETTSHYDSKILFAGTREGALAFIRSELGPDADTTNLAAGIANLVNGAQAPARREEVTPHRGLTIRNTSGLCPEQYDVLQGELIVGYLRLRGGVFTAQTGGADGPIVFQAEPDGVVEFTSTERPYYLTLALERIANALGLA